MSLEKHKLVVDHQFTQPPMFGLLEVEKTRKRRWKQTSTPLQTQTMSEGGGVNTQPGRVFLRRVYFVNNERSKYVAAGFYPNRNYEACVEFGGARRTPVVLTSYYLSTFAQRLPKLCENMCNHQPYTCKELLFRLQTTKSCVAKLIYNKNSVSFKPNEFNYLMATIDLFAKQLARQSGKKLRNVLRHSGDGGQKPS